MATFSTFKRVAFSNGEFRATFQRDDRQQCSQISPLSNTWFTKTLAVQFAEISTGVSASTSESMLNRSVSRKCSFFQWQHVDPYQKVGAMSRDVFRARHTKHARGRATNRNVPATASHDELLGDTKRKQSPYRTTRSLSCCCYRARSIVVEL